jgi:hypothetical protein
LKFLSDVRCSFDLANSDKARTSLRNSLSNELGTLGLTLSAKDVGLCDFFVLENNELSTFGHLLSNLLLLDRGHELGGELKVSDGNIVENDGVLKSAFRKLFTDLHGDLLTLGDELLSIVLGNGRLQNFVTNGGDNSFIVVFADVIEDNGELFFDGAEKQTHRDVDLLHITCTSGRVEEGGLGADLEADNVVDHWNSQVNSFAVYVVLKTADCGHLEGSLSTVDDESELRGKDAGKDHGAADFADTIEESFHLLLILISGQENLVLKQ